MATYLLIESRDPFESSSAQHFLRLAGMIAENGDAVILHLIQNGVLSLRKGNRLSNEIKELMKQHVTIHADEFSLKERGIQSHECLEGVGRSGPDQIIETLLKPGVKAIWH